MDHRLGQARSEPTHTAPHGVYLGHLTRLQTAALALTVAIPIGGLGAWAFNPDSGAVLHSLVLWRIFGITFELGLALLLVLAVLIAIRGLLTAHHSRHTT